MSQRAAHKRPPPELIDMVIDFLHDDWDSLLNCNLCCRAMVLSCQMHLFEKVYATCTPYEGRHRSTLDWLNQLLQDSPHLGRHIKILSVRIQSEWACSVLISVSRHLGAVKSLRVNWEDKPAPWLTGLSFVGPAHRLDLRGAAIDALALKEFFGTFPNVTDLELYITSEVDEPSEEDARSLASTLSHCPIRRIQATDGALGVLVPALQCTPLKTLIEFDFTTWQGTGVEFWTSWSR
ncbi:hypothetical protein OBBRIDRAFT_602894 [Obba rivulosa]|uniref:Uncharacterized protein n=1 Tax=Obba rivulosa TaxID=1052685 RepID=A0A8E2AY48_9APHY|nr:hypothetical protein OBBRIDRAFT_602894 [Obba rivulosa]